MLISIDRFDEQQTAAHLEAELFRYSVPPHMHEGVLRYIMRGVPNGSFLTAVFSNDLMEACGRADQINLHCLVQYPTFLYNAAPAACFGSPAAVTAWIKLGGLVGWVQRERNAIIAAQHEQQQGIDEAFTAPEAQ